MVIDAHLHIFPCFGTESGGEDPRLNMRFFHYHMRCCRLRRKSDGAWIDERLLDWPGDDMREMPEVDFRMQDCGFGRAEVTINGVDYYAQVGPPELESNSAPPERMILEMERAGADMGVLQHDHVYGALNEYYHDAIRRYPGRFIALAQIREWEADQEIQHQRLRRAILEQGHSGLYFSVEPFALSNYADHLDDAKYEPLWELVRELELPVWWYLHSRRRRSDKPAHYACFMEHVAELNRWAEAHPDIPGVLTHGINTFSMRTGGEKYQIPDDLITLLKRPNISFEVLFQSFYPEYPYPGAQDMIRYLREELGGVDKMMWGSDMPTGTSWCTYKQAADYIRLHCEFLSREEKDLILGGNVARMFGISGLC